MNRMLKANKKRKRKSIRFKMKSNTTRSHEYKIYT